MENKKKTDKVETVEAVETENSSSTRKEYFVNVDYNKSKRLKFFVLYTIMVFLSIIMIGAFAAFKQWWIVILFLVLLVVFAAFIPQTLKNYPVKNAAPSLIVEGRTVYIDGQAFRASDIENAKVIIEFAPVSKIDSENRKFVSDMAAKMPEEECFGSIEISFRPGVVRKGEVRVVTIEDCLGALVAMVDAGIKHYAIIFNMKKIYEPARFTITKNEIKQAKLTDVSAKNRRKQIL